MSDSSRRAYQLGGLLVSALVIAGVLVAVLSSSGPAPLAPGKPVPGAEAALALFAGIPQSGITVGAPTAPLTLVEFGDLQCPFCAYFATHTLPTLVSRYVRTGRLRILFRSLDGIGRDSVRAARMAQALGEQNHMWQFLDIAYRNQGEENSGYVTENFLRAIAGVIPGVNTALALIQRNSQATSAQIQQALSMAKAQHLTVTPSFLLYATGSPARRFQPSTLESSSFTGTLNQMLARGGR
jgi:protein-disulfide isomerase